MIILLFKTYFCITGCIFGISNVMSLFEMSNVIEYSNLKHTFIFN